MPLIRSSMTSSPIQVRSRHNRNFSLSSYLTRPISHTCVTKNELVNNVGMIDRSGTKAFEEAKSTSGDMSMIVQSGGGLYSAYGVSDKVRAISRNNDDEQYIQGSATGRSFTEQKDTEIVRGGVKRRTKIMGYLKEKNPSSCLWSISVVKASLSFSLCCACHVALPSD